ncbi:MAG TPA: vanadium-dependent haloperoxidase [Chitinophagaceae bacterium]|nr:vanadium-dependent haloperoxidase [Chitinophagaceae bacterium]
MQTKHFVRVSLVMIVLVWIYSCKKTEIQNETIPSARPPHAGFNENNMVLTWNENVSRVIAKSGGNPPIYSRHYTMTQIAVHDALNSIVPKYQTYALMNERDKDADPDAAIVSAAYWTFKKIDAFLKTFPPGTSGLALQTSGNDWDGWYASSLSQIPDGEGKTRGIALGIKAADAIMAKRANDGYAQARVVYVNGSGIIPAAGIYRPTIAQAPIPFPTTHTGGLPYWAIYMKGFAVTSSDQFRSSAPPALTSAEYAQDYNEVKTLGARVGSTRTADQTLMANFWQETPINLWNRFTRQAILNKHMDAWRSARVLALVNVSIFDGLLTVFDGMHHFYRWRPESAIRSMQDDGNALTEGQADWMPFVTDIKVGPPPQTSTPPIPEYPASNSAIGSAAAELLKQFFDTDETNIDLVTEDVLTAGTTRHFSSFSQAAKEYGDSRIYAGFNFRFSIDAGDELGRKVGNNTFKTLLKEN